MTVPAIILAGGAARRMGGGDKGLLLLAGKPLLAHVIARLTPQCTPLALNANGDAARFTQFGLPVFPDTLPDQPGPLAGVLAGLDWAASIDAPAIISAAADTPFFPLNLAEHLHKHAGPNGLCLAASSDGAQTHRHPTFGLWPTALRHDLRAALKGGLRKVRQWADSHEAGTATFLAAPLDPFFNINTFDDLRQAEMMAAPQC